MSISARTKPISYLTLVDLPKAAQVMMVGKSQYGRAGGRFEQRKFPLAWACIVFVDPNLVQIVRKKITHRLDHGGWNVELIDQNGFRQRSEIIIRKKHASQFWCIPR